jgi:hypothetical protein
MLSILKNKENIATQILNQFDVDYDLFRNEVGIMKSNDPVLNFLMKVMMILMKKRNISRKVVARALQVQLKVKLRFLIISEEI